MALLLSTHYNVSHSPFVSVTHEGEHLWVLVLQSILQCAHWYSLFGSEGEREWASS